MTTLGRWISRSISEFYMPSVRRVQRLYFARKVLGYASLGVGIAKFSEVELQQTKPEALTPDQCIKQACLLSVNSATTLLTTTSSAVLDICKEYKNALNTILALLEQFQKTEGENPQLWDAIVEERANVNKAKTALVDLNSYMDCVEKVVHSTTEAAFLAGAEYICTALCERLYSAQKEINNQILELRKLEEEYVKIQKEIISSKGKDAKDKDKDKDKPKTNKLIKINSGKDKDIL